MSWTDIKDDGVRRDSNELLTYNAALQLLEELKTESNFYELEPAEVLFVYNDPTHPNFPLKNNGVPDLSFLGAVRARYIYSQQGESVDNCHDFKPLNPNFYTLPVCGELVVGTNYGSESDPGSYFYISSINYDGSPSSNERYGSSGVALKQTVAMEEEDISLQGFVTPTPPNQGYYFRNRYIDRVIPDEGDTIIEGRFGNSIRLGSDQQNEDDDSYIDKKSSFIHLSAGRRSNVEDVDRDDSTIRLSKNTPVNDPKFEPQFTPAFISQIENFDNNTGSEILIDSKQIRINSKLNGNIGIMSGGDISIGAVGDTVIEIPQSGEIKLGGTKDLEPVVKGDELVKLLDGIIKVIADGATAFVNESASKTSISSGILTLPQTKNILSEKVKTI